MIIKIKKSINPFSNDPLFSKSLGLAVTTDTIIAELRRTTLSSVSLLRLFDGIGSEYTKLIDIN
jgi:hypothetical protein